VIKLMGRAGGVAVPVRYDYRAIMEDIQGKIARREWPAGFKLPPPRELAVQYGVSPATIRKATDSLQLLGFLEGHQGVGVFVVDRQ
jgi:DNA-binding GntR family transcriptional regulator